MAGFEVIMYGRFWVITEGFTWREAVGGRFGFQLQLEPESTSKPWNRTRLR
jgi:hypothetical protein